VFLKTSGIQAGDLWTGRSHWKDYFRWQSFSDDYWCAGPSEPC